MDRWTRAYNDVSLYIATDDVAVVVVVAEQARCGRMDELRWIGR